ncbi:hypothetical protein IRY31_05115 [Corynebacterium afermentans subsp. lipophilum]|uniref:hypothetical protein n=1 Tax=Corynebacterium afermentans TaxID=38286 RepID=UPI00188B4248|nr:hypothetical protein [Corynebacterium afermentans]MBF4547453.1 hypothetical protein [Corynebacterium afermentans subsp. lipophilum]WJY58012.1 hypothetical protein CAFEL_01115 [Corynebacterium afermentans subsp. lipophilum]
MADKQLTVAELLARAEKENPSGPRRPRRRRSLEDGGVSVAELTDSFKKVDAKPAEVKHSSVPIDAPSDTPKKTPTQAPKPEPTPVEKTPAAPEPAKPKPKQADKPAPAASVKLRPADKPASKPAEKPAEKPAAQTPKPAPAGSSVTKIQPATDDTTVLRKVEGKVEGTADGKVEGKAEPVVKQKFSQPDDTGEIRTVDTPEPQQRADVEPLDAPEYDTEYEVEEAAVNPILLVLLVFAGVLLGVLGFLAFKWLWANTMAIVAVLVGVGVVAAVVAAVGAMASGRDKVTMIIAGLAAAVVAFGPALL